MPIFKEMTPEMAAKKAEEKRIEEMMEIGHPTDKHKMPTPKEEREKARGLKNPFKDPDKVKEAEDALVEAKIDSILDELFKKDKAA